MIAESVRAVIYSFLGFNFLVNRVSRLSKSEREMLLTKYSEVLDIKTTLDLEHLLGLHNPNRH